MTAPRPLVVSDLTRCFDDTVALQGVSFEVDPGELFGIVGPDGGGKTTLFRILTTLLLPDSGNASVLGLDVVRDLWAIRARVGYMPGKFSLYPDLSVEENLSFFASVFGTSVAQGYEVIAPIYRQIESFRGRRAGDLSGGMKQKLALCCALVHRPELLLLDEPTTGVDAVSRREFWDLLSGLRESGLPIVVATPYMDEADRCDRVALLERGRIIATDRPSALGDLFPGPLFAVRGANRYALLRALRDYATVASVHPFGEELHYSDTRSDHASSLIAADVRGFLSERGFTDVQVVPIRPGIEDAFMALMGAPEPSPSP